MADSSQDRNLPASQRKIDKAREDGQVARSRELGHFAAFGVAAVALLGAMPVAMDTLGTILGAGLRFDATVLAGTQPMVDRLAELGWRFVLIVVPVGLVMAIVALLAGLLSGGWNFSMKAVRPRFSKLDPIGGLGRMFSLQQMGQALKACALALILGAIGAAFLWQAAPRFQHALSLALPAALPHAGSAIWAGAVLLLLALAAFAVVDVPLQRFLLMRNLRMSHSEAKQEHKETEGSPEIKQRLRQRMREVSNRRVLAAVLKADIVVMNPTHFAVALKYDAATMGAPRVVAKGADLMAFRIRDVAKEAKVPVLQAPPLARALYAHAELDREIPAALFAAVAQVLAWVYQLRASMAGQGLPPPDLPPLPVPPELDPANRTAR